MIRKLRKRFILLALSVVATVILVIVAGIDITNYVNMKKEADLVLLFVTREGFVPPQEDSQTRDRPEWNGKLADKPNGLPGETAFSARYFTVWTDGEGNVTSFDLGRIAFVSAEELGDYLSRATKDKGFVGNYRYQKISTPEGYEYTFLDCEKEIDACREFVVSSVIVTAAGLAVIALLIIFLSGKLLAPVEESYRKQKQFITDAGHELKTPLTVIGANAELLELEIGEDNEWLTSIKGQVQKLGKLTKELVFLSRMDEENAELPLVPFSLKNALEECAEGFKEAAMVAGKEIVLDLKEAEVNANEEMIRRAVNLMIDNAIKYAEGPRIDLLLRKEGRMAIVETRNAASLEKGQHPELFERFYRPDNSRSQTTGGHGIGLSVVKSVAEAHGGSVSCESDGNVVTFRLSLPLSGK